MKRKSFLASRRGFTIVESMVVLGVSGALFVALVAMVSGQQERSRFNSAANNIVSQIQSTINEVSTGFYPSSQNFACTSNISTVRIAGGSNTQGQNTACVFLGRAMMFNSSDVNKSDYVTHTLVGLRERSGQAITDLRDSGTRTLTNGTGAYGSHSTLNNLHDTSVLQFGLEPLTMREVDASGSRPIIGVAFVLSPNNQLSTGSGGLDSGSIITQIVGIPGTGDPGVDVAPGVDQITRALGTPVSSPSSIPTVVNPSGGIQICFNQGTNSTRSVLVTIGGNSGNSSVTSTIYQNGTCA